MTPRCPIVVLGARPGAPTPSTAPLRAALEARPDVRVGLSLTGDVVLALERDRPEQEALRALVAQGRVEVLGAALHDPDLALIPERDAVGQIVAHATAMRRLLGVRPEGCWLPVWDPWAPRMLAEAGMRFAVGPFRSPNHQPSGVWMTEREGRATALLPMGAHPPCAVAASPDLGDLPSGPTALPSDAVAAWPRRGPVYPAADPPPDLSHDAANRLHKRMLRVSALVARLDRGRTHRPDPAAVAQARRYLFRAQARDACGVYAHDPDLRALAWRDLLRSERVGREALGIGDRARASVEDVDVDGRDEVVLDGPGGVVVVDPGRGGAVTELSVRARAQNLADGPDPGLAVCFLGPHDPPGAPAGLDGWRVVTAEGRGDALQAVLTTTAAVPQPDGPRDVHVSERLTLTPDGALGLRVDLHVRGHGPLRTRLGLALCLSVGGRVAVDGAVVSLDDLAIETSPPARVTRTPAHGAVRLLLTWPVELWEGEACRIRATLRPS